MTLIIGLIGLIILICYYKIKRFHEFMDSFDSFKRDRQIVTDVDDKTIDERSERRCGTGADGKGWQRFYIDGKRVTFAKFYDFVHPHHAPHKNVITDELHPIEGEVDETDIY